VASRSTNDTAIRRLRHHATIVLCVTAGLALAACGSSSGGQPASSGPASSGTASLAAGKTLNIAYLSFAVENSYDAPMLAAAQGVASDENATVKVFRRQ
jgi:hypothetical protein